MFLIFGFDTKRKDIPYQQMIICDVCGKYGRYEIFVMYTCFSLFFLPILRWNKKYYVKSTCCQTQYLLDPAIGKLIEKGEEIKIYKDQLTKVHAQQWNSYTNQEKDFITCNFCQYKAQSDAIYCPKCGKKL